MEFKYRLTALNDLAKEAMRMVFPDMVELFEDGSENGYWLECFSLEDMAKLQYICDGHGEFLLEKYKTKVWIDL